MGSLESGRDNICLAKDNLDVNSDLVGIQKMLGKQLLDTTFIASQNPVSPIATLLKEDLGTELTELTKELDKKLTSLSIPGEDALTKFIAERNLQDKEPPDQTAPITTTKTQTKISKPKVATKGASQTTGEKPPKSHEVYTYQSPDHKTPQQLEQQAANEARTKQDALAQISKIPGATGLKANLDTAIQNQQEAIANYNNLRERLDQELSELNKIAIAASNKVLELEYSRGSKVQATDFLSKMQLKILGTVTKTDSPELVQARRVLFAASEAAQKKYDQNNLITDRKSESIKRANLAVELAETRFNDKINNTPLMAKGIRAGRELFASVEKTIKTAI